MQKTDLAMPDLADFLGQKLKESSYRELEGVTRVSRGALENIINRDNTELPKLETLEKIAVAYHLPLWRIVEMAGADLDLPGDADMLARQLTGLAANLPEIDPIVEHLLSLHPDDLRGVVAYLEAVRRQRGD